MEAYETSATVEDHGEVRVAGVPFEPGTRIKVTITATENGAGSPGADRREDPSTVEDLRPRLGEPHGVVPSLGHPDRVWE